MKRDFGDLYIEEISRRDGTKVYEVGEIIFIDGIKKYHKSSRVAFGSFEAAKRALSSEPGFADQ